MIWEMKQWRKRTVKNMIVPAKAENLDKVTAFVNEELEAHDCSAKAQMQIELAIEELFINIASYAYQPSEGDAEVRCEVSGEPPYAVIQFLDSGVPFDPLARGEVDISQEGIMSRVGGLGIHLVKKTMDDVQYAYEDGKNILTIQKKL